MSIVNLAGELRKEFQAKMDAMLTQELQQLELDESDLKTLSEDLPGLVLPELTVNEAKKARELITRLDKKVDEMAQLTINIGKVGGEYKATLTELTGLLANKDHDIVSRHKQGKLKFMLSTVARIIENDIANGIQGFRSLLDKAYVECKLNKYVGV